MKHKKLGKNLEWHGNRIRVVIRVPPSRVRRVGATKLKQALNTADPLEAEREKVDVIKRLRQQIAEAGSAVRLDLTEQAMEWREAIENERTSDDVEDRGFVSVRDVLDDEVDKVEAKHGYRAGQVFASIALGQATPLRALLERWFTEERFSIGYRDDVKRAIRKLERWCEKSSTPQTVEAIDQRTAGRFIHEQFIALGIDAGTANKNISCLMSYWRWLCKRHGIPSNPWQGQRVKPTKRRTSTNDDKRPFTDDEIRILLTGIRTRRDWDFSIVAALSGLRVNEIADLRVRDCTNQRFAVVESKTPSGIRTIPMHLRLVPLIAARMANKRPEEFVFDELPDQKETSKRDRSAPVSQSFTRERRRLGIEEKGADRQRQSNVDFHSWRRWFIRKAVEQLEQGAKGYTPWTIANVAGHSVEEGSLEGTALPLAMTMGRYPGPASWGAMLACVNAVALPDGAPSERSDLRGSQSKRGRHPQPPQESAGTP